ncbi:MAG TPA: hypothetical protein VGL86_30585 [Polyangia bacterium]
MRRLIVSCALVSCALVAAACSNKPTSFGVDVEARTNMLPSATRDAIVSARLLVSGAETFTKDIAGVAKAAKSGSFKFRYIPGVQSGTITIRIDGLDGSGATIAGGTAPPISVTAGKSVDAVLTLAVNGNGVACMAGTDCISGNCADGFCCDTPCTGVCESCNQGGLEGVCSPAMQGTDPDSDCAAKIPQQPGVDGGTGEDDDGGVSVMPPPVGNNLTACGGTCDGNRACNFPPTTTSCGDNICAQTATVGAFFCDGNGGCNEQDTMCADFNCNNGACRTSCGQDSDCQPTDFCNLNINQCVPKHAIGATCTLGDQCQTGDCYSGVCCNTVCGDMTQSCNNPGNIGQCQCTGHACPPGVACTLFYKDGDVDGYGDKTATLTNGRAIAGCVGDTAPSGYTADNTDCDDGDANAHPGQTAFFSTPSHGTGTYDYDCDGALEKGLFEAPGASCHYCYGTFMSCTSPTDCNTAGQQSALGGCSCLFCIPGHPCGPPQQGFNQTVGCGTNGNWVVCETCATANSAPASYSYSTVQTCH